MVEIDVLRHAHAAKGDVDKLRQLDQNGRKQAEARRDNLHTHFDLVFVSPARRAVQTAEVVAGVFSAAQVVTIPELHWECDPEVNVAMEALFEKLGYGLPSAYDAEAGGRLIRNLNKRAWWKILQLIKQEKARRALVVGHAILAPGLGRVAAESNYELFKKLDVALDEAGGYRMTLKDNSVTSVELLKQLS